MLQKLNDILGVSSSTPTPVDGVNNAYAQEATPDTGGPTQAAEIDLPAQEDHALARTRPPALLDIPINAPITPVFTRGDALRGRGDFS